MKHTVDALQQLRAYLSLNSSYYNEAINFAHMGKAVIGFYVGSALKKQGTVSSVLDDLISELDSHANSESLLVQHYAASSARYSIGITLNFNADLSSVQHTVHT